MFLLRYVGFLIVTLITSSLWADIELNKYPSVYDSNLSNVEVTVAEIAGDENKVLIRVNYVNHAIDGLWFIAEVEKVYNNLKYYITWDGEKILLFSYLAEQHYMDHEFVVKLPDVSERTIVHFNSDKSRALATDLIKSEYQEQLQLGKQQALSEFNKESNINNYLLQAEAYVNDFERDCKQSIVLNIDFDSFRVQTFKENIEDCTAILEKMTSLCRNPKQYEEYLGIDTTVMLSGVKEVHCIVAEERRLNYSSDNKALYWYFVEGGSNYHSHEEFAFYNIINIFNKLNNNPA